MRSLALVLAASLTMTACGTNTTVDSSSPGNLDRSDVEDVAVAMVTALLTSDYDTVLELVVPDQREAAETMRSVAMLSPTPDVKIVSVAATVVEEYDETAIIDYSGDYCMPETSRRVPVTAVGSDRDGVETVSGSSQVVTDAEQCFSLDEIFDTDHVEYHRIDGEWYAPLPE